MASADLIIDQADAERNSFVKLFNINGRVSTFSPLEQETGAGAGDGNLKFGGAVPASLKEPRTSGFMVTYTVYEEVEGPFHSYSASASLKSFTQLRFLGQDSSARLLHDFRRNVLVSAKPHVFVLMSCVKMSVSGELLVVPKRLLLYVNSVKAAAKLGLRALIGKASVVCTTASVATTPSFNVIRQSHAVFLEEAGRTSDVKITGFFSHFWNACLRVFIGSVHQLDPAASGQNNENPFAKQLTLSTPLRWATAGLEMNELSQTSRFKNPALLELWTLTNNMSQLQAVPRSFDDTLSATYATIDKAVLGIDSNLMFVNVQDAKSTKDVSGSSYSLETAAAVMKDARIPRPSSVRTTSR